MHVKYREYKGVNYAQIGKDILSYWKENDIFRKAIAAKKDKPPFTFYEGPPSANGTPGIHHVISRTVKDIFCRYKSMKGFRVDRKGGWDTHGLPVELQVEKDLGITKEDIGKKISVEEYNRRCREAVMKYKGEWDDLTEKIGYWLDLDNPYITFDNKYMETLWHLLKQLYDKGLLYKGYTIQPFSPAAGTGLSSHELNQPGTYKEVKDTSITAQFLITQGNDHVKADGETFCLAWTTTPWTLPSNAALAVGAHIDYVAVKTFNPYTYKPATVILAKDRLTAYFNSKAADLALEDYQEGDKLIPYQVIKTLKGSQLEGLVYEQLLPYVQPEKPAFRVITGDFVTTEDGTGIVHIAPTFGADDQRVAIKAGIPAITIKGENGEELPLVDRQGRFVDEVTDFAGVFVKAEYEEDGVVNDSYMPVDVKIAIKLKEENRAFKVEKYTHTYPHCWRTDKPILYYPLESWFIKTTACKERLVALNNTINWKPASTGSGRFGNWLENLVDWNLSRSRYWGTPLPIWRTKDGKEEICIGSLDELKKEVEKSIGAGYMQKPLEDDFDLHRPFVDEIVLVSPSGQPMTREPDLIDVWFDSGAMPYAQWHYPFENKDVFENNFPADFIAEGVDQTRGWFFTLHAIAVMLFDSVAFKNVIANGLVLDKNGNKMSKRLGNAIDPFSTIDTYGPDATRWYMISNSNPWDNLKFDMNGVVEVQRKFLGTLQNTYAFFALYANLDQFDFSKEQIALEKRTESDRWIISRLNSLIKKVEEAYEDYEPTKAAREIQDFVIDDLSNWYVRLNRKRFWKPSVQKDNVQTGGEADTDKIAAYQTLHSCLLTIARLAAPIAPFYCERLFLDLTTSTPSGQSVHDEMFPQYDLAVIDANLESKMTLAQRVSSLVHSLRKQHKIKVRQPLSKILIPVLDQKTKAQIEDVEQLILTEVNLKAIEYVDNTSGVVVKKAKPNFKKLGAVYGPKMKEISQAVAGLNQDAIFEFEVSGKMSLQLNGETIELDAEDLTIQSEDIPGWTVASEAGITVALDINVTEDLKKEGFARDFVNRIQNLRKEKGMEVQDKISVVVAADNAFVKQALTAHENYVRTETQASSLSFTEKSDNLDDIEIDDYKFNVQIQVV